MIRLPMLVNLKPLKPASYSCTSLTQKFLAPKLRLSNANIRFVSSNPSTKPPLRQPQLRKRENLWTLPNILTMTRLVAAPCVGYLVVSDSFPAALGVTVYASITDFVDGYLARKYKNQTAFGSIADPAADKALMVTLASCLTYSGIVPWWCGTAILGRDIGLALSAFYIRYSTLPHPKTISRYFDLGLPSVKVYPTTISKWNTFFQMIYLSLCLANSAFNVLDLTITDFLAIPVTLTTVWSGVSYIFSKTAVQKL